MDIKALRGLRQTYDVTANERDCSNISSKKIECIVNFLNNTQHRFILNRNSKGQILLDAVFKHLNLIENDFLGLKFVPNNNEILASSSSSSSSPAPLSNTIERDGISNTKNKVGNNQPNEYDQTLTTSKNTNSILPASPKQILTTLKHNTNGRQCNTLQKSLSKNNIISDTIVGPNNNKANNDIVGLGIDNNFTDKLISARWLDPKKSIKKQYETSPPYIFYFRVKFYVTDPCRLADDTARNYLYQQLRLDILNNRLVVPTPSAILLASYILQSELGDYKQEYLENGYISNYKLLPNQSDDFKRNVIELHKQHKSLSPADAEHRFLEHASKKLDCYGAKFYDGQDSNKNDVKIGVSSNGIIVFKEGEKVNQFSWAKIKRIMFRKKIFSIQLGQDSGRESLCDTFLEFNLLTNHLCKSFWEECVAQHSFFRLHQPKSPPKKFFSFLNFGSKFQYNGKTEYQTMEESKKRSFSHFSRSPSKRYARVTIPIGRPSWGSSDDDNPDQQKSSNNNVNNDDNVSNYDYDDAIGDIVCQKSQNNSEIVAKIGNDESDNPIASSSARRSLTYIPKSLTLKSFMYIDESRPSSNELPEQSSSTNGMVSELITSSCIHQNCTTNTMKKELKRSESLRLPNSIRGAISLTKKAGLSIGNQLPRLSESLRDRFLNGKSARSPKRNNKIPNSMTSNRTASQDRFALNHTNSINEAEEDDEDSRRIINGNGSNHSSDSTQSDGEFETPKEIGPKIVHLLPGKDNRYGFKIKRVPSDKLNRFDNRKSKPEQVMIIHNLCPNYPAANSEPRLYDGDEILSINGVAVAELSTSKVETMIRSIQSQKPPYLTLEVNSRYGSIESDETSSVILNGNDANERHAESKTLADSIYDIKQGLATRNLIDDFERLSRKKEDETLENSRMTENIDKNRYQDILPYDSTRVPLMDSMTGDYINASFVTIPVPNKAVNRYIATQGPLASTCDDFWQMVWEQNSSLIIMVTPLIEGGRIKCHKYWPDERDEIRHGQIIVRNLHEKSKSATIDRTIQLIDVKSGEKRLTTQIQYKAWPDHEVPADCSDFLKLVNRVRKHRQLYPKDPIIVHCSAGIGRTGVLILMETAVCIMEAGQPVIPIKILEDMRKQRAMLIQTNSQFQFVADAICKVYDQRINRKKIKNKKNNRAVTTKSS